jgi:hypothetical protein
MVNIAQNEFQPHSIVGYQEFHGQYIEQCLAELARKESNCSH